ncbi:Actin-depolymerizing factor gmf1-like protein [Elsinoe fawcettii]|nr:Actin-depolymerizing factor gmf1-like protein [Elsinoe fawcettii]
MQKPVSTRSRQKPKQLCANSASQLQDPQRLKQEYVRPATSHASTSLSTAQPTILGYQVADSKQEDLINKSTHEIHAEDDTTYTNLQDLADELPDHSPRYILLSHPITMASGRQSAPYVMLYYLPVTCNSELKMVYAGAKELVRNTAEVQRIIEVGDAEEVVEIEEKLKGEE